MMGQQHRPISLCYSYAHIDEALRDELEKHLSILRRQGMISTWHDRQIVPGTNWSQEINAHFETAELILLLISPDFLASDYCYSVEMRQALERHERGDAQVIPVVLRPVDWQGAPFEFLQGLPRDMKPVTTWENRDEAFVDIARGIRWTVVHMQGMEEIEQSAVGRHKGSALPAPGPAYTPAPLSQQDLQNRQYFLASLRNIYSGVLADSLQGTALIALGLQSRPDAIVPSARLIFRHLQQAGKILPPETSIQSVYEQAGGELLILGEPGSGKSTLLLHLAQSLCLRAEHDVRQPLPVILNLSSWAQKRGPLAAWLVEELLVRYGVPRLLGRQWIASGQIFPLLDGLDEVAEAHRSACIDAINAYRRDSYYIIPLVVCSRTTEYLAQQRRLMLRDAIVTQPLSIEQIDNYLATVGPPLIGVGDALQHDSTLRELASSPLILNVLTLAYRDAPASALPSGSPVKEMKQQIFARYLERMLSTDEPLTQQQISVPPHTPVPVMRSRLTWLARQMQRHGQTTFYLERLQPDWLSGAWMVRAYDWLAVWLPGTLIGILVSLVVTMFLRFGSLNLSVVIESILLGGFLGTLWSPGWAAQQPTVSERKTGNARWLRVLGWVGTGIFIGVSFALLLDHILIFGLLDGLGLGLWSILLQIFLKEKDTTPENSRHAPYPHLATPLQRLVRFIRSPGIGNGLLTGLLLVMIFGLFVGLFMLLFGPSYVLSHVPNGVLYGLPSGAIYGLSSGLLNILLARTGATVQTADQLIWSWRSLGRKLFSKRHLLLTVLAGLLVGLLDGLLDGLFFGPTAGLSFGLVISLLTGLGYWLLLGFFQGVSSATIEDQHRIVPNQGIHHSAFNSLVLGLVSVVIVGLMGLLSVELFYALLVGPGRALRIGLGIALVSGLVTGLSAGLVGGLLNGGLACLRHYVLRFLLWHAGSIPWNAVPFLDEAARHILLRKVGGGYTFIHREFQDYMASLDPASTTSPGDIAFLVTSLLASTVQSLPGQEELIQVVEWCSCGYQDNRPNVQFCPSCGKRRHP